MAKRKPGLWVCLALIMAVIGAGVAQGDTTKTVVRATNVHILGRILAGPTRHTLYVFCFEHHARCAGRRSSNHPPLVAHGRVMAAPRSHIKPGKLGTRKLSNGLRQVTYYGQPLYLYKGDRKPGQINGAGGGHPNGQWYPIKPDGQVVTGIY